MLLGAVAFLAGVVTVLTPCVFVVLPVILGTALVRARTETPYVIVGSLIVSIVCFTVLLKVSTTFVHIDGRTWAYVTGIVLFLFGISLFLPGVFTRVLPHRMFGTHMLARGKKQDTWFGDMLVGFSLGPVFSSCSPTYFLILATIFPLSFGEGLLYTLMYALGLGLMLLIVALLGAHAVTRLRILADPRGYFKRGIGVLFISMSLLIMTGTHTTIEVWMLEHGFAKMSDIEYHLIERLP